MKQVAKRAARKPHHIDIALIPHRLAFTQNPQEGFRLLMQLAADIAAGKLMVHTFEHERLYAEREANSVVTRREAYPDDVRISLCPVKPQPQL